MKYAKNILETIGNTPLVQLNSVTKEIDALVLAKVETFNPGNSTKDRMALKMVEDAEADGRLKPGGTIIEGTSGNTGMGLALAAIIKGYKIPQFGIPESFKVLLQELRSIGLDMSTYKIKQFSSSTKKYEIEVNVVEKYNAFSKTFLPT